MPSSWGWFVVFLVVAVEGQVRRGCPPQDVILPCRCSLRNGVELQVWCSHSDLPRVLQGLKILGQYILQPIDELILENNNLPSLPGRAFLPLQIMRLMLRYNNLERVSGGWLSGQEKTLMEVFLVEPELRTLPDGSMSHMKFLEAVTIQSNVLKHLPNFSGLPKLRYLQIESKALTELPALFFQGLPALEKLLVSGSSHLQRLEAGLLVELPQLVLVNVSNCGVSWVHPRAFSRLPVLNELILRGNKIRDANMIGRLIRDLPGLKTLDLAYNQIDRIPEASFVDLPALKTLHLSHNRITEVQHGAFQNLPQLKLVDLNRNLVRRVHPESFYQRSGSGVEEVWLVGNEIGHVAELRALLEGLPRLVFLDLSENSLEAIPYGALRGHPTLERLHLNYNRLHLIGREAFFAMPALRELQLKNNTLSDLIKGPLWDLPALKGLDLSGNYYKTVNRQLLDNLPSLRRLDLSSNEIITIDPSSFSLTPALEHLNLSFNTLATLHPATFRPLLNLYEFDVSHNRLQDFIPGLPRGLEYLHAGFNQIHVFPYPPSPDLELPALKMLDITANGVQRIASGALRTVPQLRKLLVARNSLQYLEEKALAGLTRLEVLDLHDNRIVQLHQNSLKDLPELRKLNLNDNRISVLEKHLLQHVPRLEQLNVSKNKLTEIVPGIFEETKDLQVLDASHNSLADISRSLYGLKKLRVVNLNNNRLLNISPETLNTLGSLSDLKLSHNSLRQLNSGAFSNLPHLKTLHLDNNIIEAIESNAIRTLPQLITLKLNQNKLRELQSMTFSNLPLLQIAELQENNLNRIAHNAFHLVPHLLMLNLSHNHLQAIENSGLKNLRSIELLDLSDNRIARVTGKSLEKMEWLVELKLDNNQICAVRGAPFNGMPRLRVLSLKNNKMMSFPEEAIQKLRGNIALVDLEGNPLSCSCNMLWLKAWLQESAIRGPRCIDGGLVREMRLSKQECSQITGGGDDDPVAPGCEAELLTAPGLGPAFTPYMSLKDATPAANTTKNKDLAPLPQESDYFYDEYIDYPYNETAVQEKEKLALKAINESVATMTKKPGNTPTLYAAPNKNKTKNQVTNSPSSSGFTFFGVPLPSLNALLGTTGRKNDATSSAPPTMAAAQRKSAIVNLTSRGNGRGGVFPPSVPEIQRGGFVPIVPGMDGGFKPMMAQNGGVAAPSVSGESVRTQAQVVLNKSEPLVGGGNTKRQYDVNSTRSETVYEIRASDTVEKVTKTPDFEVSTEVNVAASSLPQINVNGNDSEVNRTSLEMRNFTETENFEDIFKETIDLPYSTTSSYEQAVLIEEMMEKNFTTFNNKKKEAPTTTEAPKQQQQDSKKPENNTATPLTSLLIPGGQQQRFKPPVGRSTITKVTSPHAPPLSSSLKVTDVSALREKEETEEIITEANSVIEKENQEDTSWYFTNYNKTSVQPFVGQSFSNSKGFKIKPMFGVAFCFVLSTLCCL